MNGKAQYKCRKCKHCTEGEGKRGQNILFCKKSNRTIAVMGWNKNRHYGHSPRWCPYKKIRFGGSYVESWRKQKLKKGVISEQI